MKRKVRPNVVSGGTAINLGDNLYYMRGKTHKQGGIDIGSNPKTGIEVENGEVVQTSPKGLRVFSAQPIFNGISPANALLMGGNPNNIFNAQEAWKQANHYNDDGTKFEGGGYTPSQEIIDYIKKTEGFRDKWYKDGNGIDTIGYGFTGSRIKKLYPNGITREQADKEFADSIAKRAVILQRDTPNWNKLSQSQRDALLSYHYNVGEGSYRNKHKKLQQALTDSDWENVMLNMDAGYNDKKNPGLRARRDYERQLFKSGMVASLTGDEEKAFRDWYDRYSRSQNLDPNPDAKEHYYDYRTYWKNRTEQQKNDEWKLGNHLPDTYKMPGHPTFSTESIYSTRKTPGGTWKQVGLGPVYDEQFVDSKYTRRLKKYNNVSFALGGEDDKFAVRDNTRTKFVPSLGYIPNKGPKIDRSNIRIDDGIMGYTPIGGDILQGIQAFTDLTEGKYLNAAIGTGLLALPNFIEKPIKFAKQYFKAGKAVLNSKRILRKYDKLLSSDNPAIREKASRIIEAGDLNFDDIRTLSYYANPDNFTRIKRKGSSLKTIYPDARYKTHFDNPEIAERVREFELLKASQNTNSTRKILDKIVNDSKKLKSGRRVALIDDYSLSGDSYPLYERVLERNARKDIGKLSIITDDGAIRMVKLNKDAVKKNWKENVDKSIEYLKEYSGNNDIPNRFTIFGNTYVPAFQLTKYKMGGIHIKPSKRGTFTAAAKRHHMSVQEFARTVLNNRARYSAAMVKKANFARNASKWHKKELGGDMTKQYYITKDNIYSLGGNVKPKAQLGTKYVVDKYGRIVPVSIPNTDINIANIGEINRLLDPVTVTDNAPKTPSITGRAEIIPQINQSIVAPNSHVIQRRLPVSIQDIVNPITSSKDSLLNKPEFNSTMLTAFPNPDFDATVGSIKEKSSTGVTPRNPYYSKLNVGLHKIGNYIKNNPDLIGLGVNLTGNLAASLINRSAIKGMRYTPPPIPISAQKLPTKVNIEPQVSSIRENVAGQERLIADNTADSRVALAHRQRVRNQGAQQYQTLFGNKLNTELQLLTADRLNKQGVDTQNVTQYTQWRRGLYDFENRKREMLAENAVAGINNAAEAIAGERGYLARREARKQDARNRALIALTSPNAQKVFDANPGLYEELIRKMSKYGGNFNLLTKRLKK